MVRQYGAPAGNGYDSDHDLIAASARAIESKLGDEIAEEMMGASDVMFLFRSAKASDLGFVVDSWAKSFYGAPAVAGMQKDDYFPAYHAKISTILGRPETEVHVACLSENEDTIVGWACYEGPCLHYVFVRGSQDGFRRLGLARQLVPPSITRYSHRPAKKELKAPDGWTYRPDLIW